MKHSMIEKLNIITLAEATPAQLLSLVAAVKGFDYRYRRSDTYVNDRKPLPPHLGDKESYLTWLLLHGLGFNIKESAEIAAAQLLDPGNEASHDLAAAALQHRIRPANYLEIHQIYLTFDRRGRLLYIAGIVPDTPGQDYVQPLGITVGESLQMAKSELAEGFNWIGFFWGQMVTRSWFWRRLEACMVRYFVERMQIFVNTVLQEPSTIYQFQKQGTPGGVLVTEGGFQNRGRWEVKPLDDEFYFFRRKFIPPGSHG